MTILRLFLVIFLPTAGVLCLRCFWSRFYIVVLGMTFFFSPIYFFQFLFGLLFPFSLWTFISLFSGDFYFLFGLLFPFSLWTFISLFSGDFYFLFGLLFFLWTFIFPFLIGLLFPFFLWTFIFSLDVYSIAVTFWISSKFFIWKNNRVNRKMCKRRSDFVINVQMGVPK